MPRAARLLVLLTFCFAIACSGKNADDGPCDDIDCTYGVCDPDSQTCVNAASCAGDEQCLEGFVCFEGTCTPRIPCAEDLPCERGVCASGACINEDSCIDRSSCVGGYKCTDGRCAVDPCADVECPRGVCNPDQAACVNGDVCTEQSEQSDCIDGYYCYGQRCELPETICDDLNCSRGVCDPVGQACVDADECQSDTECLQGNYCTDAGACETNQCDEQMRMCSRGICNPQDASCENAVNCSAPDECLDGFSCVEGSCVEAGRECGDQCTGNQVCVYVEADLVGICDENPEGCFSARDCVQGRVCVDGSCGNGAPCEADSLEPNDDTGNATTISDVTGNLAEATICQGDVDVFSFHTDDSELFRGQLLVDLRIDPVDVGAGDLILELELPDGTVQTLTTDENGAGRIVHKVSVLNQGQYWVRVSDGGDLFTSGVGYSLFVDMFDDAVLEACQTTIPLSDQPISENSSSGASFLLGSECTSPDNTAGENVYSFTIDERSWVTATVDPSSPDVNISASIRTRCEVSDDIVCSNDGAGGVKEVLSTALDPGDYFLVVQGATPASGGEYVLTFDAAPIVCGRADSSCVDTDTSRFCNAQGTAFQQVICDSGCNDETGRCTRLTNDVCYSAIDASGGHAETVDWEIYTADYDPGPNGCVPDVSGTQTSGPDVAYRVDVPPDHVVHATMTLDFSDRGALYLVSDCSNLDTCVASANAVSSGGTEELVYFNTSSTTEQLFLIADVESDSFGYGFGDIAIEVLPTICAPNTTQCDGDLRETCDFLGTSWSSEFCTFGCQMGTCGAIVNNECSGAIDLVANGPFTGRIDEYNGSYNPNFSGCTSRSASGPDSVFSVTPPAGQIATVAVNADFDAALWAVTDCADAAGTCVAGSDRASTNNEVIQFLGDGATTYYVIVDSQFSGSGMFTVSATLQSPSCTPGDALQCSTGTTLEYCTSLGVPAPHECDTTCSNAACDDPSGQVCADPVVLNDGDTVSNNFQFPNSINPGGGTVGACNFPSGDEPVGADHIYAIDLTAGDWLFADYTATTSYGIMYLLTDCADTDSCAANSDEGNSGSLVYEATGSERVYLVMDRTSSSQSSLVFDLSVDIRRQDCSPGSPAFCQDTNTLQYCDNLGFTRQYDCDGTCSANACDTPSGDVCVDAIPVQSGDTVTGDWSDGTDSITPAAPLDGTCKFDESNRPVGDEDIYRIDLAAGDLLRAELTTTYGGGYVYILEDCFDTSSCRDANTLRGSGTVYHYATTSGPAWVVVDSNSTFNSSTTYSLTVDVSAGAACAPGGTTCEFGTVSVCDEGGAAIKHTWSCPSGCAADMCAAQPDADTCATAPTTQGTVVYSDWASHTDDVTISSSACTGSTGNGADLIYAVSAAPGDVIHATVESYGIEDVQIYIATDCTDPDNSCLSGMRGDSDDRAEAFWAPQQAGTFYVVAEATSSFSDEPFKLSIEVVQQECTPGTYMCSSTGQTMLLCNEHGLFESYPCSGGCMNDTCGTPTGQACFDAIPASDGDSFAGVFDQGDALNPGSGTVGTCDFGTLEASGSDTIYSVAMQAGDVLEVNYTSTSSYGIVYILSDCQDTSSCIDATDDGTSGSLTYAATQAETVFVVMDRTTSGTTTLSYTIDFSVRAPDCTPGDPATCSDPNTLQYCDSVGFSREYTCGGATGTCTAGACDSPTADVCLDPIELTDGATVTDDFEGTDDIDMGTGVVGSCDFGTDAQPGTDHFYFAELTAGQTLTVDFTSSSAYVVLSLMSDCSASSTCIDNIPRGSSGSVSYTATADETIYVVVDRNLSGSTSLYDYTLDVTIN